VVVDACGYDRDGARCASCRVTHVQRPALWRPASRLHDRRRRTSATGQRPRPAIAPSAPTSAYPPTRCATGSGGKGRAAWVRVQGTIAAHNLDLMPPVIAPAGSALADAMSASVVTGETEESRRRWRTRRRPRCGSAGPGDRTVFPFLRVH
jgi:hypothetical protein